VLSFLCIQFSSVQFSHSVMSNSLQSHVLQHARPPCPLSTLGVYSNSCPLSWWCHPTISSSVVPFSSCLQSFPASGSFLISQFFSSGGQGIVVSASVSVFPVNIQDWFPLGWTGWIFIFSSVTQSCPTLCDPMNCSMPGLPVHHQLPEFTQTHVHQVGDAIQPSHPLSSPSPPAPQSLPASESFPMSQLFAWGGQSTGVSALASVLPKNTQDWSPLEWTGWISLQFKGFSRVFSNTTVQKHKFFSAQFSSQSNSHIHTWPLEKP